MKTLFLLEKSSFNESFQKQYIYTHIYICQSELQTIFYAALKFCFKSEIRNLRI